MLLVRVEIRDAATSVVTAEHRLIDATVEKRHQLVKELDRHEKCLVAKRALDRLMNFRVVEWTPDTV